MVLGVWCFLFLLSCSAASTIKTKSSSSTSFSDTAKIASGVSGLILLILIIVAVVVCCRYWQRKQRPRPPAVIYTNGSVAPATHVQYTNAPVYTSGNYLAPAPYISTIQQAPYSAYTVGASPVVHVGNTPAPPPIVGQCGGGRHLSRSSSNRSNLSSLGDLVGNMSDLGSSLSDSLSTMGEIGSGLGELGSAVGGLAELF